MKVLIVSPHLPSPALEMRGVRSNGQFPRFLERGCELRAVVPVPWPARHVPALEHDHGVEIAHPRYVAMGWVPGADVVERHTFVRAVAPEIARFVDGGGHIVHAHSSWFPGGALDCVTGAKVVLSMHDHELLEMLPAAPRRRTRVAQSLRRADAVVYVSEMLRRAGEALAGPHRSCVIPYGADEHPDIEPHPDDAFTVVTAARLIERKNVDDLIEAFALVARGAPDARLVVIGDGPERGRLTALAAARGLGASVEFTGALTHRQTVERIARGHVFALASIREALGTVYFEAMAVGVPVVGGRGEGIAEHVTDGEDGFLVEPGDVNGLAAILETLRVDAARRRAVAERGTALFRRSGVRWTDYADAYIELFERLLAGAAP